MQLMGEMSLRITQLSSNEKKLASVFSPTHFYDLTMNTSVKTKEKEQKANLSQNLSTKVTKKWEKSLMNGNISAWIILLNY